MGRAAAVLLAVFSLYLYGRRRRQDRSFAEVRLADALDQAVQLGQEVGRGAADGAAQLFSGEGRSITGGEVAGTRQELIDRGLETIPQ